MKKLILIVVFVHSLIGSSLQVVPYVSPQKFS
ncbi:MAG: hypothetical protein ACJAWW_002024, partial [Sulfurimonas sp.]